MSLGIGLGWKAGNHSKQLFSGRGLQLQEMVYAPPWSWSWSWSLVVTSLGGFSAGFERTPASHGRVILFGRWNWGTGIHVRVALSMRDG